ncbi:HAMP domain-containing sensor histidine kinase [Anaerocolumna sp. AGMB13025]|uniref:sensor histidine kinase n=1 Tax=Anaerocolumna sp. AGMB13025 TaxID=3039116 RepID=UPI00241BF87E|nr:HAMP domain-containing sensor histidine kinase [Anaerocolumna sp. AGMB13025]WFR56707.1 HAMP domain-containing sensor histidine kinase [Anaerocolumna sp. AGMB13025]
MLWNVVLALLFGIALLFSIVCFTKLISVKRQLKDMTETLEDIQSGNGNRKILVAENELTAELSFKMNEIVYSYEEQLLQLRAANEANRQLMTSLSHDVRTPLTTLLGYLDAVHRGVVTGKTREDYLVIARKKAHDLKDYIDTLFDWFKLNSSEFSLSIASVELSELTRNILKDWIPIFEEKNLNYEIELPEKPLPVKVDIDGYARIMNNFVQNVMTHSQATQIRIDMSQVNSEIKISVEDNGIGIDKSDLKYIFDRLYKCDKGRSHKGSGLGLAIVQQLAKKMNGRIKVQSEPNQYTIFTVFFPLDD